MANLYDQENIDMGDKKPLSKHMHVPPQYVGMGDEPVMGHVATQSVTVNIRSNVQSGGICKICNNICQPGQNLIQSCNCVLHNDCLTVWRTNNNYPITCPSCNMHYSFKLVNSNSEPNCWTCKYYTLLFTYIFITLFVICSIVTTFALFAWGVDKNKNIPVVMEACFSSVLHGFPNANTTAQWREDFKGDKHTFQYYTFFGISMLSIIVMLFYACDKWKCCSGCCDDCCYPSTNYHRSYSTRTTNYYFIDTYWYPFWYPTYVPYYYPSPCYGGGHYGGNSGNCCNGCDPDTCCCCKGCESICSQCDGWVDCNGCGECGKCDDCGKCEGEAGAVIGVIVIVILIIIVVAIIVSAIVVLYCGAATRISQRMYQYEKYIRMRTRDTSGYLVVCNRNG